MTAHLRDSINTQETHSRNEISVTESGNVANAPEEQQSDDNRDFHPREPAESRAMCMTFPGLTALPARYKLTWFPGAELLQTRPRREEEDTDLALKRSTVSNGPVSAHAVLHLQYCLHHGPAMFPGSMHQDRLCISAEAETSDREVDDDASRSG